MTFYQHRDFLNRSGDDMSFPAAKKINVVCCVYRPKIPLILNLDKKKHLVNLSLSDSIYKHRILFNQFKYKDNKIVIY